VFYDPVPLSNRATIAPSKSQYITAKLAHHRTRIIAAATARQISAFFSTLLVKARLLTAGASAYLEKPFSVETLVKTLEQLLAG
jgi:CheY-like chemotaxis protein